MRKLLTKILSVIVAVTATLGLVTLPKTSVQANEFTFGAVAGASVKYGETLEETGLRFTIEVDKDFYASLDENSSNVVFGALITTKKYATENPDKLYVGVEDEEIADVRYVDNVTKFDQDQPAEAGCHVYYASITYMFNDEWRAETLEKFADSGLSEEEIFETAKLEAMATDLICLPYYVADGETVYAEFSDARSMVKVANGADIDKDPITSDFIAKYLSTLVESESKVFIDAEGGVYGLSEADNAALNGASITADGGAGDIPFAIENGALVDADLFLEGREVGEYYYITAFKGHQVYRIKYMFITMAINEAQDLDFFRFDYKNTGVVPVHEGYYVVTNDIDASDYKMANHTFASNVVYPNATDKAGGFFGTFDGQGHVISNLSVQSNGIFGWINKGANIKNIAFTNVTLLAGSYPTLFSHGLDSTVAKPTTLSDIYVQVNSMAAESAVLVNNGPSIHGTTYNNIVIEWTNFGEKELGWIKSSGGRFGTIVDFTVPAGSGNYATMFNNVYTIVESPVVAYRSATVITVAGNKVTRNEDGSYTALDANLQALIDANSITLTNKMVANGIKSYDTYADMAVEATANEESLATFGNCWTVVDGVPYWKSLYSATVNLVIEDRNDNAVLPSDILLKDNKTEYAVKLTDATHAISNITIAGEGLVINGNKFRLAENPNGEGSIEVTVTATVNGIVINRAFTVAYSNKIELNGKVLYSANDKSLDLPSLIKAGVEIKSLEEIDGYIVNGETVNELNLEVIITGIGRKRVVDVAQEVKFMVGDYLYVLPNVYAYTQIIDEAEDLKVFTLTGATEDNPYNELDGYYIVTKNIDASNLNLDNHKFMSNASYPGNGYNADRGFVGIFDGQGYTIDNLTAKNAGLFGNTNAPIIKDIAFTNVHLTGYYPTLFANTISRSKNPENQFTGHDALLQNIYVSVASATAGGSKRIGVLVNQTLAAVVKLQNVVVDYTNVSDAVKAQIEAGNDFYMIGSSTLSMAGSTSMYENCYAISTAPVLQRKAMPGFGENQVEYTLTSNKVTAVGAVLDESVNTILTRCGKTLAVDHVIVGVRAYADYAALAADTSERNLASLATYSEDYWVVKNGVPYWKQSYANKSTLEVKQGEDILEGDIVLRDNTTELTLNIYDVSGTLVEDVIVTAPAGITVDGNVIKLTDVPTSAETYEIVVSAIIEGVTVEKVVTITTEDVVDLVITDEDGKVVDELRLDTLKDSLTFNYTQDNGTVFTTTIEQIEGIAVEGNKVTLAQDTTSTGSFEIVITGIVGGKVLTDVVVVYYTNEYSVDAKVLYSQDDKSLDFASLSAAIDSVDGSIKSLEEIDTYVVNGEETQELELEVTISNYTAANYGRNRAVDTAQEVTIKVGSKVYTLTNVYAYTKLIDETEDLKYFTMNYRNEYNEIDGYFLVTKNIDANDLDLDEHKFESNKNGGTTPYPGNGYNKDVGFRGVLDGNGYVIDGLTAKSCGLFGNIGAAVIKNIAFTNAKLTGYYLSLFCKNYLRGKDYNNGFTQIEGLFKDVYISISHIDYYNSNGTMGVLSQDVMPNAVKVENVIVEYLDVESNATTMIEKGNNFFLLGSSNASLASHANNSYVNSYSISPAPVLQRKTMPGFAENQVEHTYEGIKVTSVGNVIDEQVNEVLARCDKTLAVDHVLVGLRAYDNYEALAADTSDRNQEILASFGENWIIKNGVPYWKEVYKLGFTAQVKQGDNVVDGAVELNNNKTELTLNIVDKDGNVVESTIEAPEGIIVNGNVIKLANEPASVGYYEVKLTAVVDGFVIERWVTINYTNIIEVDGKVLYSQIDKALDLPSLNAAGVEIDSLEDIDGYVVAGEDAEVLELEVIISNATEKRVVDTAQVVSVKVGTKVYILNNVYAYTLLIDEISDIDVLSAPVGTVLANGYTVLDENAGYYMLTKNVSGAGLGKDGADYQLAGNLGSGTARTLGLTGVFDGNGYTISNAIVQSRGIFGFIKGGLVKDIGFKNMTLTGYYSCLLAHQLSYKGSNTVENTGWVINLYVENTNVSFTSSNGEYGLLFQNQLYGNVQNFVVKHTLNDTEKAKMRAGKRSGLFASQYNYRPQTGGANAQLKNWIVIGDLPIAYDNSTNVSWNKFVLGKNMLQTNADGELELINPTAFPFVNELFTQTTGDPATRLWNPVYNSATDTMHTIDEAQFVRQYVDDAALAADKAGCADLLATFTSPYWVISEDGTIAWASAI